MSISKNQIDETIAVLCREFPKCFVMFERRRRPLKLGIHLDIIAALGERIDRRLLRQALRFYTGNIHYGASQKPGVPRIDLYGNACGAVSEADAQSAARDVAARKTRKRPRPSRRSRRRHRRRLQLRSATVWRHCGKQRSGGGRKLHDVDRAQFQSIERPGERLLARSDREPSISEALNSKRGRAAVSSLEHRRGGAQRKFSDRRVNSRFLSV